MNVLVQILVGLVLGDFLAAFMHWVEDSYIDYCTRVPFLKSIAKSNELHHYFPRSMVGYTYIENITTSTCLSLLTAGVLYYSQPELFVKYKYTLLVTFTLTSTANLFHRFAHMRECELPRVVSVLQKSGLVVSHKDHSLHHTSPTESYGVISPHLNTVLNSVGFWRILEWIVHTFTGVKATPNKAYADYSSIHNYMHKDNEKACPMKPTLEDIDILKENLRNDSRCKV